MTFPKISIITVSYNQRKYIERTILSVLNQNYPNLEYIIIDGGSTDGSIEIIKKYEDRLSYWVSEKDAGQYHAINKGFSRATGDIFAFLNSDDIFLPWTLSTVASVFSSNPDIAWITSLAPNSLNSDGVIIGSGITNPISKKGFLDGLYIPGNPYGFGVIVQEGTFWRRQLWEKTGACINVDRTLAGDFDLWCKFLQYEEPYSLGLPLAAMTRHAEQRSNAMEKYIQQCRLSLDVLRGISNFDRNKSNHRLQLLKLCRNGRVSWSIGMKLLNYKCQVVDPVHSEVDFSFTWQKKQINVYKR